MEPDLSVEISGIKMKNPVMTASGTFGPKEYLPFVELNRLGALVVKTVTLKSRPGNPPPRLRETPCGVLNSIGLQNPGVKVFIKEDLPWLSQFDVPIIVSVGGETVEEYLKIIEFLNETKEISAVELNISCPNVKKGGIFFGVDPDEAANLTVKAKKISRFPLWVKLSPNVTDISLIAKVVEESGADAVSLINTIVGMAVDVKTFKPYLGGITGGLSGPAIKPIAVRMVWEVAKRVKIPVIGMGGIMNAHDALEFFLVGAKAVAVGTANLVNPKAVLEIISGIKKYMKEKGFKRMGEIVGKIII